MDNYIVSARKYRPITFDSVVGQESITMTLKNAIKTGQLAQAFLFCGPRGIGKTTCARILAKTINCMSPTENFEACDKCESCLSFNRQASFNIHELDAASNNSVQDIRNLVEQVRIPPQIGKYKVYIIDEVHMLSQAAFNAFLKTLEEPPAYAKFILATTEKNKILPTILSRCQIFDFKRITIEDIVKHLTFVAESENITAEEQALHTIAQKSDGSMRDALSLFDQLVSFSGEYLTYKNVIDNLNILDNDYFFKIVDYILANDAKDVLLTINEIFDNGFEGVNFIMGFSEHLRNLLVSKDPSTVKLLNESETIKQRYAEQAGRCPTALLLFALNIISKCDVDYKMSTNKHLLLEVALLNICSMTSPEKKNCDVNASTAAPPTARPVTSAAKDAPYIVPQAVTPTMPSAAKPSYDPAEKKNSQEPSVANEPKKPIPKISIRLSDINAPAKKEEDTDSEAPKVLRDTAYTQDLVSDSISRYLNKIIDEKIILYSILKPKEFELKDNNIIEFQVSNAVNEQEINKSRQEIADFLRDDLENDKLNIAIKVKESAPIHKAQTDADRFKEMAQKNTDINYLRGKLNLTLDM
ncbi:MAG: DNA polymerase III subunit gamma/tau [Bacteroidales bacterium]|nr:DNA polymerase III subunit gamma/tau [Bacteroidales bacterium]